MNFDQQKIEDYVLGRLSQDEMNTFQFALMRDAGLRKEVESLRALKYMARAKKRKEKRGIVFFSSRRLLPVAAVFIGLTTLAVLIALYFNGQKEAPIVDDKKVNPTEQKESINEGLVEDEKNNDSEKEKQEEIVDSPDDKTPESIPQEKYELSPEKNIEEDVVNEKIENKKQAPKRKLEFQIFDPNDSGKAANIGEGDSTEVLNESIDTIPSNQLNSPVSDFEKLMESDLRTKDLRVELEHTALLFWNLDGSTQLTFNGKSITKDGELPPGMAYVYGGNTPNPNEVPKTEYQIYAASMPDEPLMGYRMDHLYTHKVDNETTTFYRFETGITGKFWPDTYYIVINEQNSGKTLAINRFTIPNEKEIFQYEAAPFWLGLTMDSGGSSASGISFEEPKFLDFKFERQLPKGAAPEDLIPNPTLEDLIKKNLSSDGISIDLVVSPYYTRSSSTGRTEINVSGIGIAPQDTEFDIQIFSNKYADYHAGKPLTSGDYLLAEWEDENTDEFTLVINYRGKFKPGLYYVLIKKKGEDKLLAVDNFEILTEELFQVEEIDSLIYDLNEFKKYEPFHADNYPSENLSENYRPVPELEKYIDSTFVTNEVEMNLLLDEFLQKDDRGNNHIKMRIRAKSESSNFTFLNRSFKVFSNNAEDFEKDLPIFSKYVGFPYWQKNEYGTDAILTGTFKPGLYYIVFTGPGYNIGERENVILTVNKFIVK